MSPGDTNGEQRPSLTIKRLGPGDEPILSFLATHDADFDLVGRGSPLEPLDPPAALLLHEIAVHARVRRRRIGRAPIAGMEGWMRENGVGEVWVLADNPVAEEFYRACGFAAEEPQPVYLSRRLRRSGTGP